MNENFDNVEEMKELIENELSECELNDNFKCEECPEIEQCHYKASTKSSHEFAESLDYGGYDSEDEFCENLD